MLGQSVTLGNNPLKVIWIELYQWVMVIMRPHLFETQFSSHQDVRPSFTVTHVH